MLDRNGTLFGGGLATGLSKFEDCGFSTSKDRFEKSTWPKTSPLTLINIIVPVMYMYMYVKFFDLQLKLRLLVSKTDR